MGRRRIDWIDWDAQPLGEQYDSEIARMTGVSANTVRRRRLERGIGRKKATGYAPKKTATAHKRARRLPRGIDHRRKDRHITVGVPVSTYESREKDKRRTLAQVPQHLRRTRGLIYEVNSGLQKIQRGLTNTREGSLCKRGHDTGRGTSIRYSGDNTCVQCSKGHKKRRRDNADNADSAADLDLVRGLLSKVKHQKRKKRR